jgi:hypothetical protein
MARAFATRQAGLDKSLEEFGRGVRSSRETEQRSAKAALDILGQLAQSHRELVRAVVDLGELATRTSAENTAGNRTILFWARAAVFAALLGIVTTAALSL